MVLGTDEAHTDVEQNSYYFMSSFPRHMTCVHALLHKTRELLWRVNFNKKIDRKNLNFGNKTAI